MSELIGVPMTKEKAIDLGLDLAVHCMVLDYEDNVEDTFVTLRLNVLGVIYSVTVSKYEADNPDNIKDAWKALIHDFGVFHLMGQSKRVQDGHREITADEKAIIKGEINEESK